MKTITTILALLLASACSVHAPKGTEAEVDTIFGDMTVSVPDEAARAEQIETDLLACVGPYVLAVDYPQAKQLICDCHRRRGQTDSHFYLGNCVGWPDNVRVIPNEVPSVVAPPQAVRDAEGNVDGEYVINGTKHRGIGNNLDDERDFLENYEHAVQAGKNVLGEAVFNALSKARQEVVSELCCWIGEDGYKGFTDHVRAMKLGLFHNASEELKDSELGRAYPSRVGRLATTIEKG